MQTLNITLYLDGRPGHEKQSRGVIEALKQYMDVEVTEVTVGHKSMLKEIAAYSRYLLFSKKLYRDDHVDLVIGSGSRTHIPLLSGKRISGARAITCMTPSTLLIKDFDLCFIPIHDRPPSAGNIFPTIGPPNISRQDTSCTRHKNLILVGGVDSQSHIWDEAVLESQIRSLLSRTGSDQRWTVTSSPRTPLQTEAMLESISSEYGNVNYYPFTSTPSGWVENQYLESKTVWVTADSISMVYEALSAGCQVGILPVRWRRENNKFRYSEQYLIKQRRAVSFNDWRGARHEWLVQTPLNEADRCAKEILRRWWPKNLP